MALTAYAESRSDTYKFLTLPNSAFVAAMGGTNISVKNADVNLAFQNPALLTPDLNSSVSISYTNYITDVNYGTVAYAGKIDSLQSWGAAISYVNYGTFDAYTEDDIPDGTFSANDFCLSLTYSHQLFENVNGGIALKPIFSQIESYKSFGIAFDFGANYYNEESNVSISIAVKNVGTQIKGYYHDDVSQHRENIPWDIQAGISKKLSHAPFRLTLTAIDLNNWNLNYNKSKEGKNNSDNDKISWGDMLFRHLIPAVEFIPSKSFNVQLAYNHRRNKENALDGTNSFNGFSFGAGLNVRNFKLGVAYAQYAAKGNSLNITLSTNLNSFKK